MATRNEVWLGFQIIKKVVLMNDALDLVGYLLHDKEPENGTHADFSVSTIKTRAKRMTQNALGHKIVYDQFVANAPPGVVANALSAWGLTEVDIQADVNNMKAEADKIIKDIDKQNNKAGLKALGDGLDAKVDKVLFVNRPWMLE